MTKKAKKGDAKPVAKKAAAKKSPRSSETQAKAMKVTREQHAKETAQDYLEAISDLIEQTGEARVVDLASRLGISHATVIQTIRRLQRDDFVTSEPYRSIFLTNEGRKIADFARHRHAVTVALLRKLGVSTDVAEVDAEGMEHHVSKETLKAFENFVGKI